MKLYVGQLITLKSNDKEGWKEEKAKILELQENGVITVQLINYNKRTDDGLREITEDQIKE